MIDRTLREYIEKQRALGATDTQIRSSLELNNWKQEDIDEALSGVSSGSVSAQAELPTGRQLLRSALHEFGERFWTLLELVLIPALVVGLAAGFGLASIVFGSVYFSNPAGIFLAILLAFLLFAAAIYVAIWSQIALLVALRDRHERIGARESYRRGRSSIGRFFSTAVLSTLVTVGGLLLFVVPGFIFMVWFAFVSYLVVVDGHGGFDAMLRSRELVSGRFGKIFWRFVFITLVLWLASALAQLLFSGVAGVLGWPEGIASILSGIFQFVITPIAAVYSYLLFEAVRALPPVLGVRPTEKTKKTIVTLSVAGYLLIIVAIVAVFLIGLR